METDHRQSILAGGGEGQEARGAGQGDLYNGGGLGQRLSPPGVTGAERPEWQGRRESCKQEGRRFQTEAIAPQCP